jgi:hypothetical protein
MKIVGVAAANSENGQKVYRAGFVIYDSTQKQYRCDTPEQLWKTLQEIVDKPEAAQVNAPTPSRKGRTTKEQEEDFRKLGNLLVSNVPAAGPVLNIAGDFMGRLAGFGKKRR